MIGQTSRILPALIHGTILEADTAESHGHEEGVSQEATCVSQYADEWHIARSESGPCVLGQEGSES